MGRGSLAGRRAIVTGASRRAGIGAAICRALARNGADVVFTHWRVYDRSMPWGADEDGPDALAGELRASGVRCVHHPSVPEAGRLVLDAAPEATILVNNAAHSAPTDLRSLDAAELDRHYAVNVRAAALASAELARRWRAGSSGRIINIGSPSTWSIRGRPTPAG